MQCNAPCTPTTAIVNAGKSRIYGFEAELSVSPFRGLRLAAAYSHLNSKLQKYVPVAAPAPYFPVPVVVGGELPFAMPHHVTASASYTLPLPESVGSITIGGTFVYQSRYKVSTTQIASIGYLPASKSGNLHITWEDVAGLPIDAGMFVSNVTNEQMYTNVNDQIRNGFISYSLAEPRMFGAGMRGLWTPSRRTCVACRPRRSLAQVTRLLARAA